LKRRKFIQNSLFTTAAISAAPIANFAQSPLHASNENTFKLKFAPHIGMFKHHAGDDPISQLNFMADSGFTAFEDNEIRNRSLEVQEKMAQTMQDRNITMGVFVAHKIYWKEANLASGKKEYRDEFLKDIKDSVAVAKRVNAKWITVVPGHVDLKQDNDYQTIHVVDTLKRAANVLEPHNITMVLEPLNFRNHPGLFLTESPQAYQICKAVNSPSCKILFDIYHQQIQEGNLIPNIEACWDEIAYFQIGDNPGRNEPTTGEINYKNVFKYIHNKGYKGILGMEHGNSIAGKAGEERVIKAYQESTNF